MKRFLPILMAVLLTSCVQTVPVRPQAQYDLRINPNSRDELFIDDIGVSLRPIMPERAKNIEALHMTYQYWNPQNPSQKGVEKTLMVSLPSFEVQVTNSTQFSAQFHRTTARLVDDAGNTYPALLKQDVIDLMNQKLDGVESRGWRFDRSAALGSAKALRMFDKNYESLPGITEKRILSFELNTMDASQYQKFLASTKYFRVMLFNVPVKFDQAGNVAKATKFEYVFDVVRK
ncbi:MAG TPA: hypothetical protein PLU47_17260 [Azonexus sp.]|nr:hypothetical protein [Azonexus sp.]